MLKPLVFGLYVRRLVLMSISARDEPRQIIIRDIRPRRPYTVQCSTQAAVVLKKIAIFRVLLDKQFDAETISRIQFMVFLNQMLHIRSEERRVGKEWRFRGWSLPEHEKRRD